MSNPHEDELFRKSVMTFGEHLEELRRCLWRALWGLLLGVLIGFFFADAVVRFIQTPLEKGLEEFYLGIAEDELRSVRPNATPEEVAKVRQQKMVFEKVYIQPQAAADGPPPPMEETLIWRPIEGDRRTRTQSLGAAEPFMIWLKAALLTGLVLSSPWVFFQLWSFVAAGLYPTERHYVYVFMPFSIGLFLFGAATAFFFVFEPILNFFFSFNRSLDIDPVPRISEWLNFVLFLPLGFGLAFQLPLVMLFLERIGVFNLKNYIENWRIAVLVIWVLAAVLTPADPYSIFFLAVPLMVLYFGGLLLCKWWPRNK